MYAKVLDNITASLKRGKGGKGEEAAFSLPDGKVSHLILSKIVASDEVCSEKTYVSAENMCRNRRENELILGK